MFSIQGALQLKQDFDLIRDLIRSEEYSLSEELHQSLLSLRVFQQVDSAIVCLLQQPLAKTYMPSRGWEPFRRCCESAHTHTRTQVLQNCASVQVCLLDVVQNTHTHTNRRVLYTYTHSSSVGQVLTVPVWWTRQQAA